MQKLLSPRAERDPGYSIGRRGVVGAAQMLRGRLDRARLLPHLAQRRTAYRHPPHPRDDGDTAGRSGSITQRRGHQRLVGTNHGNRRGLRAWREQKGEGQKAAYRQRQPQLHGVSSDPCGKHPRPR